MNLWQVAFAIGLSLLVVTSFHYANANQEDLTVSTQKNRPPNILLIVADDMGYSDIGVLGSEIETPNIDRLAGMGTLFTRFYTAATCSPTRSMLLTGVDHHLVGLGNMEETMDPGQAGKPGYEGYLNRDAANIAEIFSTADYQTYMTGKWHLGMEHDQSPFARGFEKTFTLLAGGASHFSDRIGQDVYRTKAFYRQHGELIDTLPDDFYSSNYFTDTMIRFIREGDADRPFLGYLALTAPHWPLQAPDDDIEAQRGKYSGGYEVIRHRRFQKLKESGIVPPNATLPDSPAPAWDTLSAEEQARSARTMEVYAAMVSNMDANIGRLVEELESSSQLEDTVIVFLSDNGADGLEFEAVAPAFQEWTDSFDNRLENIGRRNSFVSYGQGWAQAGEAPHSGFKGRMTEGGTRSPMFLVAPMATRDRNAEQAARYPHPATVRDILPTLMDLAGISNHGRRVGEREVHPISGVSLQSALTALETSVHSGKTISAELWNSQSVIRDDWKLLRQPAPRGDGKWKLFDLSRDPGETGDLSEQHPDVVEELIAAYRAYAEENHVIEPTSPFHLVKPENPGPEK